MRNVTMQLRKVCNHPFILDGLESQEVDPSLPFEEQMLKLIKASGKTIFLDKLLAKLFREGHRVLIFSQFKMVLDLLEDFLVFRKYKYERLDGGVDGKMRQEAIDRFSAPDSDRFVFLLTTRAGGVGINLTAADTVIIFDSDWNPQQDIQAQARCHRIGQTKTVKVFRLISKDCYESEMFKRSSQKLGLDRAILSGIEGGSDKKDAGPSNDDLEKLLRYGAYHMMNDSEEVDENAVFNEDIDAILSKAKTVQLVGSEEDGAFARVQFVGNSNDIDVHVNDPDFWNKLGVKRRKKQTEYLDRSARRARGKMTSTVEDEDRDEMGETDSEFEKPSSESSDSEPDLDSDEQNNGEAKPRQKWSSSSWSTLIEKTLAWGVDNVSILAREISGSPELIESNVWKVVIACFRFGFLKNIHKRLLFLCSDTFFKNLPGKLSVEKSWFLSNGDLFSQSIESIVLPSVLMKPAMISYFQQSGKQIIDRYMDLCCLRKFLYVKEGIAERFTNVVQELEKNLPSDVWTQAEDIALLECILKHGYGRWDVAQRDELFSSFLNRAENVWPRDTVLERRAKNMLSRITRFVYSELAPNKRVTAEITKKPGSSRTVAASLKKDAAPIQSLPTQRVWNSEDAVRMLEYLNGFPINPQKASTDDYTRMGSIMSSSLDIESLKRLHAALMKAFYRVAVLVGEFPVLLQDHITHATVNINLNSDHCKAIISNSELLAQIDRCLSHPSLHHVIVDQFPNLPSCPSWWNNDVDLFLLRSIARFGFVQWRKAVQDQAYQVHLGRVISEGFQDAFIIERVKAVAIYLTSQLSRNRPVKSLSDDDVVPLDAPPPTSARQTPPVPIKVKPENVLRKVAQEPPMKPPRSGGLIPPLNKKPMLKQSNVAQYFVQTNNATSVQQPTNHL
eukprot:TRINITY_DN12686_c0_g2_i1.p1 TRINITY_DN12686_c0_g2~~TRINITY_DN12686_c0_g2_i1.p1  ORF type:complete len:955 (+),score=242.03 TRINITY_DN12686_c0_g2_i1:164-2866(+)